MLEALLLLAVDPDIGGLLMTGEKGTAKSTAARGLLAILPDLSVRDCPFHCLESRPDRWCPSCASSSGPFITARPPLRTVPLGVSEERLLGGLDWEATSKSGRPQAKAGLIAEANNGLLYIDEVNLLDPPLAHLMLDAVAGGEVDLERDGLAARHPARVALLGSMNPEEGPLGPQLSDRFALTVKVEGERDPARRARIVRLRLAWEKDPVAFERAREPLTLALRALVLKARALLASVALSSAALGRAAFLASEARAAGHRAELALGRAAKALAALRLAGLNLEEGPAGFGSVDEFLLKEELSPDESLSFLGPVGPRSFEAGSDLVDRAEPYVIPERRRPPPKARLKPVSIRRLSPAEAEAMAAAVIARGPEEFNPPEYKKADGAAKADDNLALTVYEVGEGFEAVIPKLPKERGPKDGGGRRALRETLKARGRAYKTTSRRLGRPLSLAATLRAAAPRQPARRERAGGANKLILIPADFREKVYRLKTGRLVVFVVDSSGSIGALYRMEEAKAEAMALLRDAYQKRDRVAIIAFYGQSAEVLLPPTNSPDLAGRLLASLPSGGKTPLAAALALTKRLIDIERVKDPKLSPHVVLMTDGRPNIPLDPSLQPWPEALDLAARLAADPGLKVILIDTDRGAYNDYKLTRELAARLGCRRLSLEDLKEGRLDSWLEDGR
jgi:magnesium chelatase subunit D